MQWTGIKWLAPGGETATARVKVYPRIGGGTRRKDFGYVGRTIRLLALGYGTDDLAKVRAYVSERRERLFTANWGGNQKEPIRVLVLSARTLPVGGGCFNIELDCEVVE